MQDQQGPRAPGTARSGATPGVGSRVLVTGGAGFLGSHLTRRLLARGDRVVVVDDLSTGRRDNLRGLEDTGRLTLLERDVAEPLDLEVDQIFHLACPASPVHYQSNPVQTLRTCVLGSFNVLELARRTGATVLLASTSEVYGDPAVHPQDESYWGNVNPVGPRACYDEGKRCAEAAVLQLPRAARPAGQVARIFNTYGPACSPTTAGSSPTSSCRPCTGEPLRGVRRRLADPLVLLRRRPRRGPGAADGHARTRSPAR